MRIPKSAFAGTSSPTSIKSKSSPSRNSPVPADAGSLKRRMDFLNGIIYAIEGKMEKLGPGIVLCVPKGFEIEGNISEDDTKKSSKKNDTTEW